MDLNKAKQNAKDLNNELDETQSKFGDLRETLGSINSELGKKINRVKDASKAYTTLGSIAQKFQSQEEGLSRLSDKQIKQLQEKAKIQVSEIARASELLFTAKLIDPKTAKEWGLISDFYKDEDLMVEANNLALSIVKQPPDALRMSKKLLREGMGVSFDNILEMSANMQALMHLTDDHQEALSAFFEKRDGDFKGK